MMDELKYKLIEKAKEQHIVAIALVDYGSRIAKFLSHVEHANYPFKCALDCSVYSQGSKSSRYRAVVLRQTIKVLTE